MQRIGSLTSLSASDLVGHLHCAHLTQLNLRVLSGALEKPKVWDPFLDILRERGAQHEADYLRHLEERGLDVVRIGGVGVDDTKVADTRKAMEGGASIIFQGALRRDPWLGRVDFLQRVPIESDLGAWSYEVIDTKLAMRTKGGTVLQLCMYSDLVADVQGRRPEKAHVIRPWSNYVPESFRLADFAAYYRLVQGSLGKAIAPGNEASTYPTPNAHCEVCQWRQRCDGERRADDHLSLVAGITKVQIAELNRHEVRTAASLAALPVPLSWKPTRGSPQAYERVAQQARIQVRGRAAGSMQFELLPILPALGLSSLPIPSSGDIFLDLEGDPFVGEGGIEYLFGYGYSDESGTATFVSQWAVSREEEKLAFERFVDFVMNRLKAYPDLHIYHYAPYEPAALKRLMGRYATREDAIDRLLRGGCFVDLYNVVRNALRASVESYSIKRLEALYSFVRAVPLGDANKALFKVQACLELGAVADIEDTDRLVVAGYNREDCLSAQCLRDWLETRRSELVAAGTEVPRPARKDDAPSEEQTERAQRIQQLMDQLTRDVPVDTAQRTAEQHGRWLLAHCLDWHRQESNAGWWEYFRLAELSSADLLDERNGLAELVFVAANGGTKRSPIHRYAFPAQDTEVRAKDKLRSVGGAPFGEVVEISADGQWLDIKKREDSRDLHPEAVFSFDTVGTTTIADAVERIGAYVAKHGLEGEGQYQVARDLLLRLGPRTAAGINVAAAETGGDAAVRLVLDLRDGLLPIQGPPGAGKTYAGARMIARLVQQGRRVGVTANSHKVIRNLLNKAVELGPRENVTVTCVQKITDAEDDVPGIRFVVKPSEFMDLVKRERNVSGGTKWAWVSPEASRCLDVLFVDEAAQMSLPDVLAVSQAANNVVLLGDPQQLQQPIQASHPDGTEVSALHHVLNGQQTIAGDRGLFLAETWRLHPDICAYTSELFYEGRLRSYSGTAQQTVHSSGRINGTGLRYVPLATVGNRSSSPEEAACIEALVREILDAKSTWVDREGREKAVRQQDILIIAPYNAQVFELKARLPNMAVGTVDKFQGQEAAIVIYSMTTSSHEDAPRGMEFLYSPNRLNVATSRAMCLSILVASPAVFEPECRTPRQMQLANALCRYLEVAQVLGPSVVVR